MSSFVLSKTRDTVQRVLAPFRAPYDPEKPRTWDKREAFYCHGYKQPGEHYHKSIEELEACECLFT
jgi:hypothetical protein